jgi:hypothetical protein
MFGALRGGKVVGIRAAAAPNGRKWRWDALSLLKEAFMSEAERQRSDPEVGTCSVCGRTCSSPEELSKHLFDEHEGDLGAEPS